MAKLTSPNPYTACLTEHAEHQAPGPHYGTIKGLHEIQALQLAPPWLVRSMHLHNQQLGLSQGPPGCSECPWLPLASRHSTEMSDGQARDTVDPPFPNSVPGDRLVRLRFPCTAFRPPSDMRIILQFEAEMGRQRVPGIITFFCCSALIPLVWGGSCS